MSLMTGRGKSLEAVAIKLNIKEELVELCVRLGALAKYEMCIENNIRELKQSPSVSMAFRHLGVQPEVIEALIKLSFNTAKSDEIPEIMERLGLKQYLDVDLTLAIASIAAGQ